MSTVENGTYTAPPPDEEELLLSKLVFGDTADFHESLAQLHFLGPEAADDEHIEMIEADSELEDEDEQAHDNMDRMNDDQLFFVDDGADDKSKDQMSLDDASQDEGNSEDEQYSSEDESAEDNAWSDSDDERVEVAVPMTNRTKKLRTSYTEGRIKGRDYVLRLRAQYEKIYPRPKWVDSPDASEVSDENDSGSDEGLEQVVNGDLSALSKILQSTYTYHDTSSRLLPPKSLDIIRLKDANAAHPSRAAIQSLSFHPSKPLLLTGGYDRTLRIYHIDGKNNHLVTSLYLTGTPVQTCAIYVSPSHKEQKIFTAGRRRYMHSWDISSTGASQQSKIEKISRMYGHEETQRSFESFKMAHFCDQQGQTHGIVLLQGNNGWVNVLNATSGVWMTGCKIEGVLADFCVDYKPISNNRFQTVLLMVNTYGEIWEFDLARQGEVMRRWRDEGNVGITTIQVGGGNNSTQLLPLKKVRRNRWLAIGSESGYVHVYDRFSNTPEPVAKLDQLTTPVSSLAFSPDGQILCMASRATKDSLRLVHLPSGKVFSNWPTSGTPLGKVTSVAFSPRGEMLAAGNEQGKVRLWRLNHYV
ncbi:LADA_0E01156g1_1 [Lachancea dasiensis]|uniref:LADA_0E01156g1_1 n=1 Tax=Lachancea dasiensis TaxID=1072105 RepID=A0A1G4JA93_9SACH|nr:LADA_0E01156g1_1 [Lachancea dasiensis]